MFSVLSFVLIYTLRYQIYLIAFWKVIFTFLSILVIFGVIECKGYVDK